MPVGERKQKRCTNEESETVEHAIGLVCRNECVNSPSAPLLHACVTTLSVV